MSRKPLVYGAAIRFAGQLAVFDLRRDDSPCYHCLFPDETAVDGERCATMGVFALVTGVIGTMQAGEASRLIAERKSPWRGILCCSMRAEWNGRQSRSRTNPNCKVCS
jgi:molybdopterin-synthase adenylyltransferase